MFWVQGFGGFRVWGSGFIGGLGLFGGPRHLYLGIWAWVEGLRLRSLDSRNPGP